MDEIYAVLAFVLFGVGALIYLRVPRKPPPAPPGLVKCPKCTSGNTLKDIGCPNCGNKELKINKSDPAKKYVECPKCGIPPQKLPCQKCGTDLRVLLLPVS
jgi:predicted RNA-binding Zn-ribbon protein involved in translation (DUF1610 family)